MRVDILGLVPEFGRKAFRFEYYIGWGFVVSVFYYVEICSLFTHFGKIFVMSGGWILSNAFSASIEIVMWLLSFFLLMWCITLIDLWTRKNSCIPGMNPISSWPMIFLMYCWIQIAGLLLRIFASIFISDIGLHLFSCDACVWFWYQSDGGLIEWVRKFSFLCNFLEQFWKDRD